jgi:hypothetical protein
VVTVAGAPEILYLTFRGLGLALGGLRQDNVVVFPRKTGGLDTPTLAAASRNSLVFLYLPDHAAPSARCPSMSIQDRHHRIQSAGKPSKTRFTTFVTVIGRSLPEYSLGMDS